MIEGISGLLEVKNREVISKSAKIVFAVSLVSLAILISCMHLNGFPHSVAVGLITAMSSAAQTAFLTWICINNIHFSKEVKPLT